MEETNSWRIVQLPRHWRMFWLMGLLTIFLVDPVLADYDPCSCKFRDSTFSAIGTKAACVAKIYPGGESCVIEFSGVGANKALVEEVTGINSETYSGLLGYILFVYAEAFSKNDFSTVRRPDFLSTAIPVLARGAYLRDPNQNIDSLKKLDSSITEFAKEYSSVVRNILLGSEDSFEVVINEITFLAKERFILIDAPDESQLIIVVAPPVWDD